MAAERRIFELTEVRADKAGGTISGHAAVFNSDSLDLGGFIEQIRPGAFSRSLRNAKEKPVEDMIHVFWSHDPAQPLASTRSGKLKLTEDDRGLRFEFPSSRLTPAQLEAIEDGDMRMSFGFYTKKDEWTRGAPGNPDRRTLLDVDLFEISPVSKPAYPDTKVAVRSHDEWKKTVEVPEVKDTPAPTPANDLQKFKDRAAKVKASL